MVPPSKLAAVLIACAAVLCLNPAALAQSTNKPIRDKWAFIVGISKFEDQTLKLDYSAKDARDFADFLTSQLNFQADHVKLLTDSSATRRQILSLLGDKWLPRVAGPDDLVLVYFSSHGSAPQQDVVGKNYLVAYDTERENLYATGIEMQTLAATIKTRVHADRIIVILDACHSGSADPQAKGMFNVPGNFNADQMMLGTGQMVICSSMPDQISWESKRYQNSIFTHYLIDALRQKEGAISIAEAFNYIKDNVEAEVRRDYGKWQVPVMKSKWDGKDVVLSVIPSQPGPGLDVPTLAGATTAAVPSTLWQAYNANGQRQYRAGDLPQAEKAYESALAAAAHFDESDERLVETLDRLAVVEIALKGYSRAEELLQRALKIDEKMRGELDRSTGLRCERLGMLYYRENNWEQADTYLRRALAIWEKTLWKFHPKVGQDLDLLANVCRRRGQPEEAEQLATRALEIMHATDGKYSYATGRVLHDLTLCDYGHEKARQLETNINQAGSLLASARIKDDPNVAIAWQNFGDIFASRQQVWPALISYERSLRAWKPIDLARATACQQRLNEVRKSHGPQSQLAAKAATTRAISEPEFVELEPPQLQMDMPDPPIEFGNKGRLTISNSTGSVNYNFTWDADRQKMTVLNDKGQDPGKFTVESYDGVNLVMVGSTASTRDVRIKATRNGTSASGTATGVVGFILMEFSFKAQWD